MIVFVIFLNGCVTGMIEMTEVYRLAVVLVICVIGGWQTFEGFALGAPAKHAVQKVGQAIHDLSA